MNRRQLLYAICIAMAGTSLPSMATAPSRKRIAVLGIGGAGGNLTVALRASGVLERDEIAATYLCLDTDERIGQRVRSANGASPHLQEIRSLWLEETRVSASAGTLPGQLSGLIAASDSVVLLAGLGGAAGSTFTPMLARAAKHLGIEMLVSVVLPFSFEGERVDRASLVLAELQNSASQIIVSSNESLFERYGDDLSLMEAFDRQQRDLTEAVGQAIGLSSPS